LSICFYFSSKENTKIYCIQIISCTNFQLPKGKYGF
jgi:hypothetical protein